jgi:selenocysteine lyase/cysteine desulfurase
LPWLRRGAAVLPVPADTEDMIETTAAALQATPQGPRLLAVTGASNVTGELWPLAELVQVAHAYGARVLVDAAQLVPHRTVDLAELGADYLAFSGHKLYASFGAGALVGRSDWLDSAAPYLDGGGAVRRVRPDHVEWLTGPARHEAGTPNLIGIAALAAACLSLADVGMDSVQHHEAALLEPVLEGLGDLPSTVYSIWPPGHDRVGVVSFNVDGIEHDLLAAVLDAEYGIGIRAGSFRAHPLMDQLSAGGPHSGAARLSIGVGTTGDDIERLLEALGRLVREGPNYR